MPTVGFEPAISARERPQTHTLDHAATGIDKISINMPNLSHQEKLIDILTL
jgi:hypothetical protein